MKPQLVFLEAKIRMLRDPDALSLPGIVAFRNGGTVNGEKAILFVEVTPEIMALLQTVKEAGHG